jgi:hypothetical protein
MDTQKNSGWWLLIGCLAPFVTPLVAFAALVGIQAAI